MLDWDDDEATRKGRDVNANAVLPSMDTFNPRIRIIGIPGAAPKPPPVPPAVTAPQAHKGPVSADVDWDVLKTRKMKAVSSPRRPLPPPRPAQARVALVEPLDAPAPQQDAQAQHAQAHDAVSISPIVEVGELEPPLSPEEVTELAEEPEPETLDPRQSEPPRRAGATQIGFAKVADTSDELDQDDDISHVRNVDEVDEGLSELGWSDHENGTQPMVELAGDELPSDLSAALAHVTPPPEDDEDPPESAVGPISLPSWEDEDDVTMPQRFANLRERARALAEAYKQRHELEVVPRSGAQGDTLVELEPPSAVKVLQSMSLESPSIVFDMEPVPASEAIAMLAPSTRDLASPLDDPEIETQPPLRRTAPSAEVVALPEPLAEAAIPDTLPRASTRDSVEIDLAELDPQPILAPITDDDDPRAELTPPPQAYRPSRQPSVAPMTYSQPPSAPATRRGPLYLLAAVALVAGAAMALVFLTPQDGTLQVRLRTADGSAASRAEIFVDGQKRCDTDPCVVTGLSAGDKTVKVLLPGVEAPQVATAAVVAGEDQTLWIDIPAPEADAHDSETAAEAAPAPKPAVTIDLATKGARVVLTQRDGSKRILRGPWPMELPVDVGHYKLVASRGGYATFVHEFSVDADDDALRIDIALDGLRRRAKAKPAKADASAEVEDADFDPYAED